MALRWFLHSACHVVGIPKDPIQERAIGDVNSLKVPPTGGLSDQSCSFQLPLHYPRYKKADYEKMEEWRLDLLLKQYGLDFKGTLDEKKAYAMGAFLWPDQY